MRTNLFYGITTRFTIPTQEHPLVYFQDDEDGVHTLWFLHEGDRFDLVCALNEHIASFGIDDDRVDLDLKDGVDKSEFNAVLEKLGFTNIDNVPR